jgi:hypothetical protein
MLQEALNAQEAKFRQQSGDDGLVCMEAENYSSLRESTRGTYWDVIEDPENYSGTGGMQAFPNDNIEHKDINNAQANAPVLEYTVNFVKAGQVYVWARSSHVDGYDDSVWFGLDDLIEGTLPLTYLTSEQSYSNVWYWISYFMGDIDRAILQIPSTGVHVFKLYMREPSFKVDKIVLTTNETYHPNDGNDQGPPETLEGGSEVAASIAVVPQKLRLYKNYPNPFNPATTIRYSLPKSDFVTFKIYNLVNQEVVILSNTYQIAGDHQITWTAAGLPSGLYFFRLQAGEFSETKKLILQK